MAVQSVQVPQALAAVLNRAGDRSGVDFDYLVQTAMRESSFDPSARAPTSSATGLFQFIESTWFEVMKSDGPRLGYGNYARAIEQTPGGDYTVRDRQLRREILTLREDPQISADLAAAFTRNNGEYLAEKFGRHPSPGELYIAHFMGARGAEKLFQAGLDNPDQRAADLFPTQAQANRSIFFDAGGARTIREVYQNLVAKHAQLQDQMPSSSAPLGYAPQQQAATIPARTQASMQAAAMAERDEPFPAPRPESLSRGEAGAAREPEMSDVPRPRHGPPVEAGARPATFEALYQAERPAAPRTVVVDPGAAFFVQLYNR